MHELTHRHDVHAPLLHPQRQHDGVANVLVLGAAGREAVDLEQQLDALPEASCLLACERVAGVMLHERLDVLGVEPVAREAYHHLFEAEARELRALAAGLEQRLHLGEQAVGARQLHAEPPALSAVQRAQPRPQQVARGEGTADLHAVGREGRGGRHQHDQRRREAAVHDVHLARHPVNPAVARALAQHGEARLPAAAQHGALAAHDVHLARRLVHPAVARALAQHGEARLPAAAQLGALVARDVHLARHLVRQAVPRALAQHGEARLPAAAPLGALAALDVHLARRLVHPAVATALAQHGKERLPAAARRGALAVHDVHLARLLVHPAVARALAQHGEARPPAAAPLGAQASHDVHLARRLVRLAVTRALARQCDGRMPGAALSAAHHPRRHPRAF